MITLKNVSKTLGKHLVLDNINYTFENGMVYGLCGHNGSGKTMLLRAIAGLIVPDDGEIIIDGEKLHRDSVSVSRRSHHAEIRLGHFARYSTPRDEFEKRRFAE